MHASPLWSPAWQSSWLARLTTMCPFSSSLAYTTVLCVITVCYACEAVVMSVDSSCLRRGSHSKACSVPHQHTYVHTSQPLCLSPNPLFFHSQSLVQITHVLTGVHNNLTWSREAQYLMHALTFLTSLKVSL